MDDVVRRRLDFSDQDWVPLIRKRNGERIPRKSMP